jgi:hypothetical protein
MKWDFYLPLYKSRQNKDLNMKGRTVQLPEDSVRIYLFLYQDRDRVHE